MRKKIALSILIVMCVFFIVGLVLVFKAPSIGERTGVTAVHKNGGYLDTELFDKIVNSTTTSYRIGGVIFSLVGGCGLVVIGNAFVKKYRAR